VPWGYAQYLEAVSDPHQRHAEFVEWLGRRDPNGIDIAAMEAALSMFVNRPSNQPLAISSPGTGAQGRKTRAQKT
jgi:hypothetical protein